MSNLSLELLAVRIQELLKDDIRPGFGFVVAVSGGLDSMLLLHAADRACQKLGCRLVVAHFHHGIRGPSADADARLVQSTAKTLKLPFVTAKLNVRYLAKSRGISIEMAGREARHAFLAESAKRNQCAGILLAHHADDQLELLLLRLARGTAGLGLAGMQFRAHSPADPEISLFRPLLEFTRKDLEQIGIEAGIRWREDPTNQDESIPRNRLRRRVLPELNAIQAGGAAASAARAMRVAGDESAFVRRCATDWLALPDGRRFETLDRAVQRQVVLVQLEVLGIPPSFEKIEQLRANPGQPVNFPDDLRLQLNDSGHLSKLECKSTTGFDHSEACVNLRSNRGLVRFSGTHFEWRKFKCIAPHAELVNRPVDEEWMDCRKLGQRPKLRHWQPGDRFVPLGLKQSKKVQDIWVNKKVPADRRRRALILEAEDGQIAWIEGIGIGEAFRLEGTKAVVLAIRTGTRNV